MDILKLLKPYKNEVTYVMRTGNVISIFLKDGVKVQKTFSSQGTAIKKHTILRKELEGLKVGD